jgi:2-polyprenyl-3-methyl-5-hydroxy-6-metoxy-1,4-benzoquinol methylase
MERLEFDKNKYIAIEGAIHLSRYSIVKTICKGKRILDIACGEGYGSYLLSQWGAEEVVGIDISQEAIEKANKHFKLDNINFYKMDAGNLNKIEDASFDLIVSFETIEHLKNPGKFLKEVVRVATKNAIIVISCPNDYFYYPDVKQYNPYHTKKYTFEDFVEMTESILGKNVNYFLGTYINGYINLSTEKIQTYEMNKGQEYMLDYENIDTMIIPPDTIINKDNCCYYIGIWNAKLLNHATIYPYSHNEIMKNQFYYSNAINTFNELEQQIRYYKMFLELLEKENEVLKENVRRFQKGPSLYSRVYALGYRVARKAWHLVRRVWGRK